MCSIDSNNNELAKEQPLFEEPSSPIGRMQLGLAASFVTPSPKKPNEDGDRFVNDGPFINDRKPSNYGKHTLIPVMVKMIHSAIWECDRLFL